MSLRSLASLSANGDPINDGCQIADLRWGETLDLHRVVAERIGTIGPTENEGLKFIENRFPSQMLAVIEDGISVLVSKFVRS
jgi:hypothetical protein